MQKNGNKPPIYLHNSLIFRIFVVAFCVDTCNERIFGKRGTGVSVEAKVRKGPVTNLGLTQTNNGKLKFIISEGVSTDGEIMTIGNTQTHVKFSCEPDEYMDKWFKEAPTHHFAMSVGHNASLFEKVAKILNISYVVI